MAACARRELLEETRVSADPCRVAFVLEAVAPEASRRTLDILPLPEARHRADHLGDTYAIDVRSASSRFTEATAPSTPLPSYRAESPSRRSTASRDPIDAPDGTPARAAVPSPSRAVTASVGRPRESRISSADRSAQRRLEPTSTCARRPSAASS